VLCSDPFVQDPTFLPAETVVQQADVLFLATPHAAYRSLKIPEGKILIDVWSFFKSR
jgi:UDP-N-acetyl-D-mannosaminuronic acid dehydrogenase